MNRTIPILFALVLFPPVVNAQQAYIFSGTTIAPIYNTSGVACNHWEIWLLHAPQGVYNPYLATSSSRWGVIEGKTAEAVLRDLQRGKEFQKRFEKWWGGSFGPDNYDNPVGPICITDAAFQAKPSPLQALDKLAELGGRMDTVMSLVGDLLDRNPGLSASNPGTPYNPYMSSPLHEYLQQIADANERVSSLYDMLSHGLGTSMAQISTSLDRASQDVATAEATVPKLQALANSSSSQGNQPQGSNSNAGSSRYGAGPSIQGAQSAPVTGAGTSSSGQTQGNGGPWQSTGMGISISITRVNPTTLTWAFRNDSNKTLRSMDFDYTFVDAGSNRQTTAHDILPLPLRPGGVVGGWAAYSANTRGSVSIAIKNHRFDP